MSVLPLEVEVPGGAPTQLSALENRFLELAKRYSGARVPSAESTAIAVSLLPVGRRDFRESDGDLAVVAARASTLYALHATFRLAASGKATLTGRVVRDDGRRVAFSETEMAKEPKDKLETLVAALALKLFMDLRLAQLPPSRESALPPPTQPGREKDQPLVQTPTEGRPPLTPTGDFGSGLTAGEGASVELLATDPGPARRASPAPAYALLGVGGAAVVAGVVLLAMVPPLQRDPFGNFAFEDRNKVNGALQLQTAGWSLLGGGAAVAGGGGVWWWLTSSPGAKSGARGMSEGGRP